ncbi:MAG TPA: GAF domain-containing protein [Streptosporangiaceae bacterium]
MSVSEAALGEQDQDAGEVRSTAPVAARAASLIAVAEDLAGEFSLRPLLERILRRCTELLSCDAGSVCSVDEAKGTYRKEADIGVACQSGQVFPLTEGMTGAVVAHRASLWFDRYDEVPGGHVPPADRATLRGVIGVPLEWRGRIIGVCIVFSRDENRQFGPADAELLELFAQHAAIALANSRMHEAAEDRARAEAASAERDRLLAELHDTLTQRLVSVQAHLDSLQRDLMIGQEAADAGNAADPPGGAAAGETAPHDWLASAASHLAKASAATRDALVQARQSLMGLSAPPGGQSLADALGSEAAWAESIGKLEVKLVTAGQPTELDSRLYREVLWAAREALTNIVRHARASTVRIGLLYDRAAVSLLVQDDGQGFDLSGGWHGDRFGLRAMTERAREIGATVDVDSMPGWGTRIRARFPYLPGDGERAAPRIRVLIVARRPLLRAGLSRLLTWTEPGAEIVGEVPDTDQAVAACQALKPDVALVDLGLRPTGQGDVTGALLAAQPRLAVIGLCRAGDDELVAAAMRSGASGCVDVGVSGPELAQAVVVAARGQAILSDVVLGQLHRGLRGDEVQALLTEREREVRSLMELGLPDRAIAQRLVLSVKTVEKHAGAVLRKTGARNRTELAARTRLG